MPRKSPPEVDRRNRLEPYNRKRTFSRTPEPGVDSSALCGNSFVVQEHHARSLHYDFRLEMDGVLVSWAVPKGIPEDPQEKRLAVHVEDHPLEYGSFQGTIPKGNYGAGEVKIWDSGTWHPLDPKWEHSYRKGKLKFRLDGEKLSGDYLLALMGAEPNWLLRKLADTTPPSEDLPEAQPAFIPPQLATVVSSVPSGPDWVHEIKFDGYRLIAVKNDSEVTLFTRNQHDWTDKFPGVAASLREIPHNQFVLDGEAVVFDDKGRTDFGSLQAAIKNQPDHILFIAFDILNLNGRALLNQPLSARQERLAAILETDQGTIRRSKVWNGGLGSDLFRQACANGLEGIMSKKAGGRYLPGQRRDWLKSKSRPRQEFIICGYTPPKGGREGFGALILGSHENGKLISRGKVGTGFTAKKIGSLLDTFSPYIAETPPFSTSEKGVTWLRPELVAEIEFAGITREGSIRQGSFISLREHKPARNVRLEAPASGTSPTVLGAKITHPDRVVFPRDHVTKIQVARYFEQVGELMEPYIARRPLAILRAPDGIDGQTFFQKNFPTHIPPSVDSAILDSGTTIFTVSGTAGLVSLVQSGAIEFHPWGALADKPDKPDFVIWDLDPDPAVSWKEVLGGAFFLRDILVRAGLNPMVKTSGGKGIHLYIRIRRAHDWETIRDFSRNVARTAAALAPSNFLIQSNKSKRKGKIFIDWMRNGRGSTCIAPWGLRARDGAKISMPVSWQDLPDIPSQGFNIHEPPNIPPDWEYPASQSITRPILDHFAKS